MPSEGRRRFSGRAAFPHARRRSNACVSVSDNLQRWAESAGRSLPRLWKGFARVAAAGEHSRAGTGAMAQRQRAHWPGQDGKGRWHI